MVDYKKIISEINKALTAGAVKMIKDDKNKFFFDPSERMKFMHHLIDNEPDKKTQYTKEVGVLLVKVKKANETKKKDDELLKELENEQSKNTIAYQVLNGKSEEFVDKAIDLLRTIDLYDVPQGKDKLKERITKVEFEIKRLKKDQSEKNILRRKYLGSKGARDLKLEGVKKDLVKKENLLGILKAMVASDNTKAGEFKVQLGNDTTPQQLSALTDTYTINDWSNNAIIEPDQPNSIEPWDTNRVGTVAGNAPITGTLLSLLRTNTTANALKFFNGIVTTSSIKNAKYFQTSVDTSYNDRIFECKNNLAIEDSFTYSFLRVLRDIGADKLKDVINSVSGLSNDEKTELGKYAEQLTHYISQEEAVFEMKDFHFGATVFPNTITSKQWAEGVDKYTYSLLGKKLNQYPYVQYPDWKKLFKLMKKVFPATWNGKEWETDATNRPYLTNPSDPNYLRPSEAGKKGWDNLVVSGWALNLKGMIPATYAQPGGGGGGKWILDNATTYPKIKEQLDEGVHRLANNKDFKSLVKIWWDTVGGLIDLTTDVDNPDWKKTGTDANAIAAQDVMYSESNYKKTLNNLRFIKTMRQILLQTKIITQPDELDYFLIAIADKKGKKSWLNVSKREDVVKDLVKAGTDDLRKRISAGEIWDDVFSDITDPTPLIESIAKDKLEIRNLEEDIQVDDLVKGLVSEVTTLQLEIDKYETELHNLQRALLEEDLPPEDKKKKFNDVYDEKTNGKWTLEKVKEIIFRGDQLKLVISDDEWESEIKTKQEEAKLVLKNVNDSGPGHITNIYLYKSSGTSDKERIKWIKKEAKEKMGLGLEVIKDSFEGIEKYVNLDTAQQTSLTAIKTEITNPTQDEDDTPTNLTGEKLNTLFGTTGISDKDIKLSEWQDTNNFKTDDKIKALVEKYAPGSTDQALMGEFKGHLAHVDWGGKWGGKKFDGSDYWINLVKEGPQYVIGAIKHFEWEQGKGEYSDATAKAKVLTDMETYNDEEKAKKENKKIEKKWNKDRGSHIAQFLFRKATGGILYKETTTIQTDDPNIPKKDEEKSGFKAHMGKYWGWYVAAFVLVAAAGAVIFWWDDVKKLLGMSSDESTEEDKENE